MHNFQVNDMTCGHCVARVEEAVKSVDADAAVKVDLSRHTVTIESKAPAIRFADVITEAGYTPSQSG